MRNRVWMATFVLIAFSSALSAPKIEWNAFQGIFVAPAQAASEIALPSDRLMSARDVGGAEVEETLRGTVAFVDERNDKVSVRLLSDQTIDLKVGDGLLFNALRYGDAVSVTVKTVGGMKTIVGLVRE